MSSYIKKVKNPKTRKLQEAYFIDDYFGSHRYGVLFFKNGKDADWDNFNKIDKRKMDVYKLEEILNK